VNILFWDSRDYREPRYPEIESHRVDDVDQSIRFSSLSGALFADAENRGRVLQRYVISRILRNNWQVAKSKRETVGGWEATGLDLNSEQMTIGKRGLAIARIKSQ